MSQIILFEMPEDPAHRPVWLEHKLRSRDCKQFLEELLAIQSVAIQELGAEANIADESLDDFLGPLKVDVLKNGLRGLPTETFEALMRSPELLADLVIEIELEGGDYWRSIGETTDETLLVPHKATPLQSSYAGGQSRRYWLGAMTALAAVVLLAITLWPEVKSNKIAWERSGIFDAQLQGADYLNHLATAADEWFKQDPKDPQQLKEKIKGFRRGCDLLLAASHPQLSDIDRAWLRERCIVWSKNFDQQLASLSQGDDWSTVRNAADETVMKLIDALRNRTSVTA